LSPDRTDAVIFCEVEVTFNRTKGLMNRKQNCFEILTHSVLIMQDCSVRSNIDYQNLNEEIDKVIDNQDKLRSLSQKVNLIGDVCFSLNESNAPKYDGALVLENITVN